MNSLSLPVNLSCPRIIVALAAAAIGSAQSASFGAVLYNSVNTSQLTAVGTTKGSSAGSGNTDVGDDYNTGYTNITITGFSFYGGVQNTNDYLKIVFYDTHKNYLATAYPFNSEIIGTNQVHTLSSGDFLLNGSQLTIPGAGYVFLAPFSYTVSGPNGEVPGDPNEAVQYGFGGAPTFGANNSAISAETDNVGNLTTGNFVKNNGASIPQYLEFSISGTGIGGSGITSLPEPMSLALLSPAALLLLRRVRQGACKR